MKLITFTGSMGSGKSTAIEFLKEWRPNKTGFINVKFAGPLYKIQELVYDLISPVYQRPLDFVKDRKLLQWLGTNWGRETIKDSIWVDLWRDKVTKTADYWIKEGMDCYATSDDVRFDNEADAVHSLGGYVVRINCTRNTDRITTADGIKGHASESGISQNKVDFEVSNDNTKEEFKEKLEQIFEQIVQNNKGVR